MKHNTCILCGFNQSDIYHIDNGVEMLKCSKCGLVYSSQIPNSIFERDEKPEILYEETETSRNSTFTKFISILNSYKPSGKLCDVGCRTGNFIRLAEKYYNVVGVEVSETFAKYCYANNLNVYNGTLKKCQFGKDSFDIVTYLSVFEHLADPCNELNQISKCLKSDGILLLEIPNLTFWNIKKKVFKLINQNPGLMPLNHLFYYNRNTIKGLLAKYGFDVILIEPSISCEGQQSKVLAKMYTGLTSILSSTPIRFYVCNNLTIVACKRD